MSEQYEQALRDARDALIQAEREKGEAKQKGREEALTEMHQSMMRKQRRTGRAKRLAVGFAVFVIMGLGTSVALQHVANAPVVTVPVAVSSPATTTTVASSVPPTTVLPTTTVLASPITQAPQIGDAQVITRPPTTSPPTTSPQLPPVIVRGVVTCANADPAKVAQVVGPLSDQEIYKAVGC